MVLTISNILVGHLNHYGYWHKGVRGVLTTVGVNPINDFRFFYVRKLLVVLLRYLLVPEILHEEAPGVSLHQWKLEKLPYDIYSVSVSYKVQKQSEKVSSIIYQNKFRKIVLQTRLLFTFTISFNCHSQSLYFYLFVNYNIGYIY